MPEIPTSDSQLPVDLSFSGSCLCGGCKWTFSGQPILALMCHCLSCKKWSGSTFSANILLPKAAFTMLAETPSCLRTFPDGDKLERSFCATCGSSLFCVTSDAAGMVAVTRGTINEPAALENLEPTMEVFCQRRESWLDRLDKMEKRKAVQD